METLVILHGWGSSKEKWQALKKELEKKEIRVLAPDLPGFKDESKLSRAWTFDDYLRWLEALLKKEEKFFLLGHSFGGGLAVKFASRHPDKIKGLILVSAGIVRMKTKKIVLISKIAHIFNNFCFLPGYKTAQKLIYYKILKRPDYLKAKGELKQTFKNIIAEDLTPILSKIKTRTLIIWGKNDKLTPLQDAEIIHKNLKNSQLKIFDNVGHLVHRDLGAKVLAQEIIKFIKQK